MKKQIIYALPCPEFFTQCGGTGGHITHALGVTRALLTRGFKINFVAEEKPNLSVWPELENSILPLRSKGVLRRLLWGKKFCDIIGSIARSGNIQFCYIRYSTMFAPMLGVLKRRLPETPLVIEVNSLGLQRTPYVSIIERYGLAKADLCVCVSESVRDVVVTLLGEEFRNKILVIPNGVDPERFQLGSESEKRESIRIAYCGVLKADYGIETLIDAYSTINSDFPNSKLVIIGDGPAKRELEKYADKVSNVTFTGHIEFEEIPEVLSQNDILVHTSSDKNAFQSPIKVYEYMMAGKAIVAAGTPQNKKIFDRVDNIGLVYQIGNYRDLAAKLRRFICESDFALKCGENARSLALEEYTWEKRIENLLKVVGDGEG